jgi:RNA polymerase sigma factor (sigma-70 family)
LEATAIDPLTYRPMVASIVRRLLRRMPSRCDPCASADDLFSDGMIGVLKAARRFDASRGVQFQTFAHRAVCGAITDYLRSITHERVRYGKRGPHVPPMLSLDCPRVALSGASIAQIAVDGRPGPQRTAEARDTLDRSLRGLGRRERLVVLLDADGFTGKEIAQQIGCSESLICKLRAQITTRGHDHQ